MLQEVGIPVEAVETLLNTVERVRSFHYIQKFVGDVEKSGTRKDNIIKLWKQSVEAVE